MGDIKVAILTVSDSCSAGTRQDESGQVLKELIAKKFLSTNVLKYYYIIKDDVNDIKNTLIVLADAESMDVIFTNGGTGFTERDVTPEATMQVLHKKADSLQQVMLMESLKKTPYAALSRGICGVRGKTLIINLPGSPKGVTECFAALSNVLGHAIDQLRGNILPVAQLHDEMQQQHMKQESGVDVMATDQGDNKSECSDSGHHHHHHHDRSSHKHDHDHSRHDHDHDHDHEHEHVHRHAHHHHHHHHPYHVPASKVDSRRIARRPRSSPYPMLSVQAALDVILQHCQPLDSELRSFEDSLGKVIAEDVFAKDPLPPFRASMKDGYAVVSGDGAGPRRVVAGVNAGDFPAVVKVESGWCARVSTGGAVPPGADAVVQVEDTRLLQDAEDGSVEVEVEIVTAPVCGQDIRPEGCDMNAGEQVLAAGARLGPCELGVLAAAGVTQVRCHRSPVVGIMSTGNEVADPGEQLLPGQIRDSNRVTLLSALREQGFEVKDLGIVPDSPDRLVAEITRAHHTCDVLVSSGGVSMGEKDFLKQVLETDFNATVHFARVFMKPGKPTTFATVPTAPGRTPLLVFALPGNPVSATVTCHLFVLPALRKLSGWTNPQHQVLRAVLGSRIPLDPRPEYHRALLDWSGGARGLPLAVSTGNQLSSRLMSLSGADALLVLPSRDAQVSAGATPVLEMGHEVLALMLGRGGL